VNVGRKCIEISKLGIDVEVQQERHPGILGSLPDDDSISITLVVGLSWSNSRLGGRWLALQTAYLIQQYLLLLLDLAKLLSQLEILRLDGVDLALLVVRPVWRGLRRLSIGRRRDDGRYHERQCDRRPDECGV